MKRLLAVSIALMTLTCLGCSQSGKSNSDSHSATVFPSGLAFDSQAVGTTSTPQTVTLTNIGSNTVTVASISASNGYSQGNNCASLEPGEQCSILVFFTPAVEGTIAGSLTINQREGSDTQTVVLSGTGFAAITATDPPPTPTAPTVSPSRIDFGSQTVGTSSPSQTVTVTNGGTSTITVDSVAVTSNFSQTNGCASLAPGAQCTISLVFDPAVAGTISGSLTIAEGSTTQTVALTGTAIAATHSVALNWSPSPSTGVVGYNVYRSTTSGGGYMMLNSGPVTSTSFLDSTVTSGNSYYYVCTAVSSTGAESDYSNQAVAAIP